MLSNPRRNGCDHQRVIVIPHATLLLAALLLLGAGPLQAQVNETKYENYFLVGQFGEICTMCEIMVLCEAGDSVPQHAAIPDQGSFTLYHIHTRTFWSQVSTIWEWFIANFDSSLIAGHSRPVTVYTVNDGTWAPATTIDMRVSLDPPLLTLSDGHEIERVNRQWRHVSPPAALGYCQRLPLWESLAIIEKRSTGGARQ